MEVFLNQTADGESDEFVLAGEYTVHVSGVFKGAALALYIQSAEGGDFIKAAVYHAPSSFNLKVSGTVKFELSGALAAGDHTSATTVTVYIDEF